MNDQLSDGAFGALTQRVVEFTESELFARTFAEGMTMVEDTAGYLDGPGREESRQLDKPVALAYAAESMRLTTRLMQVASWLLVQRAIQDGEMTPADARDEKYRLGGESVCRGDATEGHEELPARLLHLLDLSERLYERVMRLDERLYVTDPVAANENPAHAQLNKLHAAFGAR